jgi:hypothetical protein
LSSRSGGIDGLPTALYIASNVFDSPTRISSAIALRRRSGWSAGIRFSGETTENIEACFSSAPRMPPNVSGLDPRVDPDGRVRARACVRASGAPASGAPFGE